MRGYMKRNKSYAERKKMEAFKRENNKKRETRMRLIMTKKTI